MNENFKTEPALDRYGTMRQKRVHELDRAIDYWQTINPDVAHKLMLKLEQLRNEKDNA